MSDRKRYLMKNKFKSIVIKIFIFMQNVTHPKPRNKKAYGGITK